MQNPKRIIQEGLQMITASDNPVEHNLCGAVKNLIAELENTQAEVSRLRKEVECLKRSK